MFRMFNLNKKRIFRIVYVLGATFNDNLVRIDLKNMQVAYIRASNLAKAMSKFCVSNTIFPHVYIYECKEVKIV